MHLEKLRAMNANAYAFRTDSNFEVLCILLGIYTSAGEASRIKRADYHRNLKSLVTLKPIRFLSSGVWSYLHLVYLCACWIQRCGVLGSHPSVLVGNCSCIYISFQLLSLRSSSCFGYILPRLHLSAIVCYLFLSTLFLFVLVFKLFLPVFQEF